MVETNIVLPSEELIDFYVKHCTLVEFKQLLEKRKISQIEQGELIEFFNSQRENYINED